MAILSMRLMAVLVVGWMSMLPVQAHPLAQMLQAADDQARRLQSSMSGGTWGRDMAVEDMGRLVLALGSTRQALEPDLVDWELARQSCDHLKLANGRMRVSVGLSDLGSEGLELARNLEQSIGEADAQIRTLAEQDWLNRRQASQPTPRFGLGFGFGYSTGWYRPGWYSPWGWPRGFGGGRFRCR